MHFTIRKPDDKAGEFYLEDRQYVVGHDLGEGWKRHIVQLEEGDTADNPSSTKGPIHGPCLVVYDVARTGIHTHIHNSSEDFYNALFENEQQKRERG